ncbi:MAG: type I 3-dehydroquinate dehydratase [Thaumarchaeota archaeon]|nr:type I 3-dehydroquinate dehydratase [Candidatus Calditenuaceae archaeon]MDW8187111.1 type I 3-dehydroquinate dehydratase [Nitrososphaerota archaeon]
MGQYRVCVSLMADSEEEFMVLAERALDEGADAIELRLDRVGDTATAVSIAKRVKSLGTEVVSTFRTKAEGGQFEGSVEQLAKRLSAVSEHSDLVDIDLTSLSLPEVEGIASDLGEDRVLASAHLPHGDQDARDLVDVANRLRAYGYIVKVVTSPESSEGVIATLGLYRLMDWSRGRLIAFSSGQRWSLTRPLSLVLGAPFTYAALRGREVAPGQLSVRDTKRFANFLGSVMIVDAVRANR